MLLRLAYQANDDYICWARQSYFADLLGVSVRTVNRIIAELVDLGLVEVINRTANGRKISNKYRVLCSVTHVVLDTPPVSYVYVTHVVSNTSSMSYYEYTNRIDIEYKLENGGSTTEDILMPNTEDIIEAQLSNRVTTIDQAVALVSSKKKNGKYKTTDLTRFWQNIVSITTNRRAFELVVTKKQEGQISKMYKDVGDEFIVLLTYVVTNWIQFTKFVSVNAGKSHAPIQPELDYLQKYINYAGEFLSVSTKHKNYEDGQSIANKQKQRLNKITPEINDDVAAAGDDVKDILKGFL